jgi:hypothetical protein
MRTINYNLSTKNAKTAGTTCGFCNKKRRGNENEKEYIYLVPIS